MSILSWNQSMIHFYFLILNEKQHSRSILLILHWTVGSALCVQGQLPRVEGPVCGSQIVQRGSTRVHESEGRVTQWSQACSPVATKWTNKILCGWLIEIEHAREEKVLWVCIHPDSHISCFALFWKSSKVVIHLKSTSKHSCLKPECLLPPPRLPSAAAASPCQVSAPAAWRMNRCWRPSWGPIPAVTSCMWWTPGLRWALRTYNSYSTMLYVQVGFIFHSGLWQLDVLTTKAFKNILTMCLLNNHQYCVTAVFFCCCCFFSLFKKYILMIKRMSL